jgi:mono/diheme cytochrome c family protein
MSIRPGSPACLRSSSTFLSARMRANLAATICALLPGLLTAAEPVDYTAQVKPIFARHCVGCHGPQMQRSGLRLDSAAGVRDGGNSGPAITPGNSATSLLVKAVTGARGVTAMPQKGPRLSDADIAVLRAWIDAGAPAPKDEKIARTERTSTHWAFQPIRRSPPPAVKNAAWVRTDIDRFILARLEKEGVAPSPEADRVTLIRRLSLDLLGLPPAPNDVDALLSDKSPDWYEQLVDRLLASPHYGERWGRHWLDYARYADSNGYSIDTPRTIWPYRDWVIDAVNRDLPFDQFTIEQLAGDLLPNATVPQRVATGFHRNTQINEEGGIDVEQFRVESIVDRVNTTGSVWLGLTIGCCQCHDHKFDPISQREYYQLFAFFNSVDEPALELPSPEAQRKRNEIREQIAVLEKRMKALEDVTPEKLEKWEIALTEADKAKLPKRIRDILAIAPNGRNARQEQELLTAYRNIDAVHHALGGFGPGQNYLMAAHAGAMTVRTSLEKQIIELKAKIPTIPTTMVVQERKTPRVTTIMLGGDFLRKGAVVHPNVPAVLPGLGTADPMNRVTTSGSPTRLDLARWLVDLSNPLTARVTMNRVWQEYFGAGIVETDNDFGTQGTAPSHPELLDYLALTFRDRAWSMKAMHRLIVTSATYRQASRARPDLATLDPRNRLLARQSRLRLDAEVVRDVALSASGLLSPVIGGPSVYPPQPSGVYVLTQVPREWKTSTGSQRFRRGMYTWFQRSAPHPGLIVFDAPDGGTTCTRRNRSNTPLQALTLLNDQGYLELAQGLASRALRDASDGDEARLRFVFRLCVSREPSPKEQQALLRLLARQREALARSPQDARALVPADLPKGADVTEAAAWTMVARALLNLDEFITRE